MACVASSDINCCADVLHVSVVTKGDIKSLGWITSCNRIDRPSNVFMEDESIVMVVMIVHSIHVLRTTS